MYDQSFRPILTWKDCLKVTDSSIIHNILISFRFLKYFCTLDVLTIIEVVALKEHNMNRSCIKSQIL